MLADRVLRGAYGLALTGPLRDHAALRDLETSCGRLELSEGPDVTDRSFAMSPGRMQIMLGDGSLLTASDEGQGAYRALLSGGPVRSPDDLVHPYLAPIAGLIHRWRGVPALHGAALLGEHGALGLLGQRERGKSTTAAALVEAGMSLLSDDLIIVDDRHVLAGPRSVDLRPAGAALLGLSGEWVRNGERLRRLAVEPSQRPVPARLRVLVHLEFGPTTLVRTIPAQDRFAALAPHLHWPGVGSPARDLLALAALPHVVLERPRGEAGLTEAVGLLHHLVERHADVL